MKPTAAEILELCQAGIALKFRPDGTLMSAKPIRHSAQMEAIARERAKQKVYAKRRRALLGSSAGWQALRRAILARDNYRCVYCGSNGGEWPLECDHIIAVTKGGKSTPENLATSCKSCNSSKRNADIQHWKPRP